MSTLYLLNYNNYYNRIVKKEASLDKYFEAAPGYQTVQNVNFVPNDYINTTQVVNIPDSKIPDYLIVAEDNEIISRWFVVGATRTTYNQLKLDLHRDVVVDNYDAAITATYFIEKAQLSDINDPAIYNSEGNTFNQIKKQEILLKDETGCPWIVGFIPRDAFTISQKIKTSYPFDGIEDGSFATISDYPYYKYQNQEFAGTSTNKEYGVGVAYKIFTGNRTPPRDVSRYFRFNQTGAYIGYVEYSSEDGKPGYSSNTITHGDDTVKWVVSNYSGVISQMNNYFDAALGNKVNSSIIVNDFLREDGKIYKDNNTGSYYRVHVIDNGARDISQYVPVSSNLGILFTNNVTLTGSGGMGTTFTFTGSPNSKEFKVYTSVHYYNIQLELLSTQIEVDINAADNRYHLNDNPYDMFCLPYPDAGQAITIRKNGVKYVTINRDASFNIATAIAQESGSANIYDVQLLPYCPVRYIIQPDGSLDIKDALISNVMRTAGDTVQEIASVVMWASTSQFTVPRISVSIPQGNTVEEKKIKNETEFWRLCSPNYNGVFEFKPTMNGGIDYIKIDCNYKPYSSYIHASINFKQLYGSDFNDSRGLICGGDFSLPQVTSAWADYQLQNKNYQQMFDRQIQNMEVKNDVAREQEKWQAASGVIGATVQGGVSGMMAAGPLGALAGLGTGAASLAGGIRDMQLNEKLRQEGIDFATDMFNMNLENIQALPQGLAKVSAFTANNKVFIFLEKYDATDIEKKSLRQQIALRGMTVQRIDTLSAYMKEDIKTYIKARLIRCKNFTDDYHILAALAKEIYEGVFI